MHKLRFYSVKQWVSIIIHYDKMCSSYTHLFKRNTMSDLPYELSTRNLFHLLQIRGVTFWHRFHESNLWYQITFKTGISVNGTDTMIKSCTFSLGHLDALANSFSNRCSERRVRKILADSMLCCSICCTPHSAEFLSNTMYIIESLCHLVCKKTEFAKKTSVCVFSEKFVLII